ncbi:hypothetical protein [Rothia halotolerans]|uniref:hypothetical protein n=1 Tax=Rothia halotolerans TaxID=405770 RepID=UPI00101D2EEE|nr:hypothetical protein [Rothia halotolerans]
MTEELSEASQRWESLPAGQRHPKNLAILVTEHVGLPDGVSTIVLQDIDYRNPTVTAEVEIPNGPICEVDVLDSDDPDSLAERICWAGEMVVDAERRQLNPRFAWADQHPAALQELVDPSIRLTGLQYVWGLPAGWVPIMNRLHRDLVAPELLGDYAVTSAGNKMSFLRVALDRYQRDDGNPDVWTAVNDRLRAAKEESLRTCDLCGGPAEGTVSFGITRCPAHAQEHVPGPGGATARPPGWRTPRRIET